MDTALPAYTFLFIDVADLAPLWDQEPGPLPAAVARYTALVQATVAAAGGTVFKTVGASSYAWFADPTAALRAALALVAAIPPTVWSPLPPLAMRMAIHHGPVEARQGDFFGPTLNRVARLLAVGHGGQILLSGAAAAAAAPPPGISLQLLGTYRLRDLPAPEVIYQVVGPAGPALFPPLRTDADRPHNLPTALTPFFGRTAELAALTALLTADPPPRLVTLLGPGGTGKTRLAGQVAWALLAGYPAGVWLVDLAAVTDPALVPGALARVLGVREEPPQPLVTSVVAYLATQHLLLVLDNCEHLLAAVTALIPVLLDGAPAIQILTTSQVALALPAETVYPVGSLAVPLLDPLPDVAALLRYEAVAFFVACVRRRQAGFTVTPATAAAVAQICSRLDGIPLALELAAARVPILPLPEIAARLDDRFRLLTGGSRTALPRQQTLRAMLDWSYGLLPGPEQALLATLSVFAGGWTVAAATAVVGDSPDRPLTRGLQHLADHSLLVREAADPPRYRMLETIRAYGQLHLPDEAAAGARQRHCTYFLTLATTASPHLTTPARGSWLAQLTAEVANLRVALDWALTTAPAAALALAGALGWFWYFTDAWTEGRQWLARALALPAPESATARIPALHAAVQLALAQGAGARVADWAAESYALACVAGDRAAQQRSLVLRARVHDGDPAVTRPLLTAALALAETDPDPWALQETLEHLGWAAIYARDYTQAAAYFQRRLALARAGGDPWVLARSLDALARLAALQDQPQQALAFLAEALPWGTPLWSRSTRAAVLLMQGDLLRQLGALAEAEALYLTALDLFRDSGHLAYTAPVLHNLGHLALARGDVARAATLFGDALRLSRDTPALAHVTRECIIGCGAVAVAAGDPRRAVQLLAAVADLLDGFEIPLQAADRPAYDAALAQTRSALDAATWAATWAAGQALSFAAAADLALTPLAVAPDSLG